MNKHEDNGVVAGWLARPLCRTYVAVVFRPVSIYAGESGLGDDKTGHWALGCPLGGDAEILGAWIRTVDGASLPSEITKNLSVRGVLRVRTFTGCEAGSFAGGSSPESLAPFCCEQVVPLKGSALPDSTEVRSVTASVARAVLQGDRLADQIQSRLTAAISRRGAFADRSDALNFVGTALYRADRQLWKPPALRKALCLDACAGSPSAFY